MRIADVHEICRIGYATKYLGGDNGNYKTNRRPRIKVRHIYMTSADMLELSTEMAQQMQRQPWAILPGEGTEALDNRGVGMVIRSVQNPYTGEEVELHIDEENGREVPTGRAYFTSGAKKPISWGWDKEVDHSKMV